MQTKLIAAVLLILILGMIGAVLTFAEDQGLIEIREPLRTMGSRIPYVGHYITAPASAPAEELREIERLSEERAREDRWALLKKKEEELKKAEGLLNEDRSRLSQWEGELERRELALDEREKDYADKEKQYGRAVRSYLAMRPASAAKVLSQQEDLLVIEIFRRMPERNVASILAEMDPSVAGAIMRKMSR
ncbi:MAG: hypothetical protein AAB229_04650 [Candidatus Hydrogenedentota bacterium]